jgi:hypothetical protein
MTIQVISNSPEPEVKAPVDEKKENAPAPVENKSPEQNEGSESETEQTEAKAVESKEDTESENDSEESDDSEKPKKKGGFQRRIDKLNAAKADAQREAEYWKQQALKSASESKKEDPKVESKAVSGEGKPNPENFETHAEYVEALTDYKLEQRDKAAKEAAQKSQLQAEHEKALKAHYDREKAFIDKTDDYKDVVTELLDSKPSTSVSFEQLLVESENGPEILYMLAKDRKEFDRLNSLSPMAVAREFGKLEAIIAAKTSEPENKPEPKKITKAPQPIAPVGTKSGPVQKRIDDPNLSQSEYEKLRREQMKARSSAW